MKKKLKENKWWIIGTAIFLLAGIIAMLVGFSMSGWSIIRWLRSPYALTFIIVFSIGLAILLILYFIYRTYKNGTKFDD